MHGRGRRLGVRLRHRMAQNEVLRLYLAATRANGTKRRSTVFARAGIGVQACCARATDGGASPTLAAWGRNQAARSRLMVQCWDLGGPGNGPHLLLCSLAASRSARCSKNAAPLSRSIGNQDRIVARVRRGGHIRPGLAVFRPRCHSCHCRGQRCGRCRGNHQIVPLFRTRAALGSAVAR